MRPLPKALPHPPYRGMGGEIISNSLIIHLNHFLEKGDFLRADRIFVI
jgi:hypothetical protein